MSDHQGRLPLLDASSDYDEILGDDFQDEEQIEEEKNCKEKCFAFLGQFACPWTLGGYLRLFFIVLLITLFALAIVFRAAIGSFLGEMGPVRAFVDRVGWIGPVTYAAIYAACTVAMVPGTVLTLASGVIFAELWVAFVVISIGSTLGAALAFLAGKTILRSWVEGKIAEYPVFKAVDAAIAKRGVIMVFLLRLSPILPFNILNYGLSLTGIPFLGYVFGSWVGMAPATFIYIFIPWAGIHALDASGQATTANRVFYGVGIVFSFFAVVMVTYFAKKAIDDEMKLQTEAKKAMRRERRNYNRIVTHVETIESHEGSNM